MLQTDWNTVFPLLTVATTAGFVLLLAMVGRVGTLRRDIGPAAAVLSVLGLAVSAGMTLWQWFSFPRGFDPDTFSGLLRVDRFAIFFNLLLCAGAVLCILLSSRLTGKLKTFAGEYYALIVLAVFGMMVMVNTTDLVVLLVGLETMSLAVYVLVGIRRHDQRGSEAAAKYFLIGAFASGFLVYGIALTYGIAGSTRMEQIAVALADSGGMPGAGKVALAGLGLVLVGLFFKVSAVPFHMWVPDAYEGAPLPVTTFMAVAVKAAAFAVLARLLVIGFHPLAHHWLPVLWALAVATMTLGNLAAIFQGSIKRMLAYSSIAHAGYLLVALASLSPEPGLAVQQRVLLSLLYYLVVYTLMNVGAFGVLIYLERGGRPMETLEQVRGTGYGYPVLGAAMAVFMFSLAGIPPTGGFMGKFYVFTAAIDRGLVWLAVIGVLNSAVSAYYYLRVTVQMYMRESEKSLPRIPFSIPLALALTVCFLGIFYLGVSPAGLLEAAGRAVEQATGMVILK
ncbi:MAG: NADH-quinone oxidoreductase subunit N [Candidatus Glassbacteria bacterium]|nr:NADH-quinone oxidoreductase subunit N [Candidatus Glassbacteria bacterium]